MTFNLLLGHFYFKIISWRLRNIYVPFLLRHRLRPPKSVTLKGVERAAGALRHPGNNARQHRSLENTF